MVFSCYIDSFYNINLSIKSIIILFSSQYMLSEAIQCTLFIVHCCPAIFIFGLSQKYISIGFRGFIGSYDSLVLSQYASCFILYRSTWMHWYLIIENSCLRCFSNCGFLSQYVLHSLLFSTLASPSRTMVRMRWILYSASNISLLSIAKDMLALAAMAGSTTMTCSSNNYLWNCRALATH